MGLKPGTPLRDVAVDTVFVGSCTNGRIEDLRAAAEVLRGRKVPSVRMLVVPGSMAVKAQAEQEGLDAVFTAAGADWRTPGCSMCLGMNPDTLRPGSAAPPPPTATSRAGRARAAAPTWSRRRSPPPPPSTGHLAAPADL